MLKKTSELKDKAYQLTNDRSGGESVLIKSGRDRRLLFFDEEVKYNRPIRHCPNEKSIFIDEQSNYALVEPVIFTWGTLEVKKTDQITQKFLEAHPSNVANGGNWFEEINNEVDAKNDIEIDEKILDIKQAIRDKSKEDEGIYALEMVVAVLEDSIVTASRMTPSELKRRLYQEASNNPYYFLDDYGNVFIFDDESLQRKHIALRAISEGIIRKSPNKKSIFWSKENKLIFTAPTGVDLIDAFAEYLSTDEGILTIEEIRRRN